MGMGMRERHKSSASGRNIRPCAPDFNNNNLPPPLEFRKTSHSAKEVGDKGVLKSAVVSVTSSEEALLFILAGI